MIMENCVGHRNKLKKKKVLVVILNTLGHRNRWTYAGFQAAGQQMSWRRLVPEGQLLASNYSLGSHTAWQSSFFTTRPQISPQMFSCRQTNSFELSKTSMKVYSAEDCRENLESLAGHCDGMSMSNLKLRRCRGTIRCTFLAYAALYWAHIAHCE